MDRSLRNRKMKIIAMLIMHFEMLNNVTFIILMICSALLIEKLNKEGNMEAEFETNSQVSHTETTTQSDTGSSIQGKKKRKRDSKGLEVLDTLNETIEKIGNVYEQASNNILEFVSCFKHEKERAERRMKLSALLKDIDGLTSTQRIKAGILITKDNNLTDYIFTLASEDRWEFVLEILNKS